MLSGTYVLRCAAKHGKFALTVDETPGKQLTYTEYKEGDVKDIQKWRLRNQIPASGGVQEDIVTMQSYTSEGFFVPEKLGNNKPVLYNKEAWILIMKPIYDNYQIRYQQRGDNLVLTMGDDGSVIVAEEAVNTDDKQLWFLEPADTPTPPA